jgi:hypothetical protein
MNIVGDSALIGSHVGCERVLAQDAG